MRATSRNTEKASEQDARRRQIVKCLLARNFGQAERQIEAMAQVSHTVLNRTFFHALIHDCTKAGTPHGAEWCAKKMTQAGIQPNKVTFNSVIGACAKVGNVQLALTWWDNMLQAGQEPNGITYNTMINAYARSRDAVKAEEWMQRMMKDGFLPCIVSFSTVIDAFAKIGKVHKAEQWFQQMKAAGVAQDAVIYNSLINACAKAGQPTMAEHWWQEMDAAGLIPDEKTYNSMINACAKARHTSRAEHWFRRMERDGCKADKITFGSVIHASAKVGDVARAEWWMDEMIRRGLEPNLVCYNTVLHACAHGGDCEGATKWFRRTLEAGIAPNKVTYNSMIDAHAKVGDWAAAEFWLQQMVESGIQVDQITFATLLCAYTAQGRHMASSKCSHRTYSAVIKACARVGDLAAVRRWLSEMANAGLQPRQELLQEVLSGCSTARRAAPETHLDSTGCGPAPQAATTPVQQMHATRLVPRAEPQAAAAAAEEAWPWGFQATDAMVRSLEQQRGQLEDACRRGERLEAVRRRRGKPDGSKQELHNQEARIGNTVASLPAGIEAGDAAPDGLLRYGPRRPAALLRDQPAATPWRPSQQQLAAVRTAEVLSAAPHPATVPAWPSDAAQHFTLEPPPPPPFVSPAGDTGCNIRSIIQKLGSMPEEMHHVEFISL